MPPRRSADAPGLPVFPSGVLNVDKAAGETSFQVVRRVRHLTGSGGALKLVVDFPRAGQKTIVARFVEPL